MGLTTTSLLNAEKFPVIVPNSLFSSQVSISFSLLLSLLQLITTCHSYSRSTILLFHQCLRIFGEYRLALMHLSISQALIHPSISYYYIMETTTMPFYQTNVKSKICNSYSFNLLNLLSGLFHIIKRMHLKTNPLQLSLQSACYKLLYKQFLARVGTICF